MGADIDLLDKRSIHELVIYKNMTFHNGEVSHIAHSGYNSISYNSTLCNSRHKFLLWLALLHRFSIIERVAKIGIRLLMKLMITYS